MLESRVAMGINDVKRLFSLPYKTNKPLWKTYAYLLNGIWMKAVSGFKYEFLRFIIGKIYGTRVYVKGVLYTRGQPKQCGQIVYTVNSCMQGL